MNSSEWINKQIANVNDIIEENQIRIDSDNLSIFLEEHYQAYHKELVELLLTLQQIKTELEAWEEINKTFKIGVEEDISEIYITGEDYYGNDKTVWGYSKEGTPKVKKALEVKEND